MWRSSKSTEEDYRAYKLNELIPTDGKYSVLSLDNPSENDKEKLLFLLGLVDTLEPIKNLGRDRNKRPLKNPYIILEKIKATFDYKNGVITIKCPVQFIGDYFSSIEGIDKWMAVALKCDKEQIEITIIRNNRSKSVAA